MSTSSSVAATPFIDKAIIGKERIRNVLLIEPLLVLAVILLVGFSLIMLYSATGVVSHEKFGDSFFYVKRQASAAIVGGAILLVAAYLPLNLIKRFSPLCFFVSVFLLVLPLVPGIGDASGGARRWADFGLFRFQPGEFVKLLFVVFMAGYFARHDRRIGSCIHGVVKPMFLVGIVAVLFLLEPDFGSTAVVAVVTLTMAMASGIRLRYVLLSILFLTVCFTLLVALSPYRMARILSFLSPWEDASGRGYQLIQSLIAVGSGHLGGVGLGDSQQKLFFLPAAHTDFIFAVIGEELGFVGCVSVITLFAVILWRGLSIAGRMAENTFYYSLAVGLTLLIVLPALLNVGVVIGALPTKGMVLPFVGYGGSSLMVSLATVGLLLGLARQIQSERDWFPGQGP